MFNYFVSKEVKFERAPQAEEDCETLLADSERDGGHRRQERRTLSWCSVSLLLIASSCLTVSIGAWFGSRWLRNADSLCTQHISQYSPILKDVDISYNVIRFNGSLLKENEFRQRAGPEVDAAWASLGVNYRSVAVPSDQAAKSGLLPDQVKISEKYGGGFPANVEGLHQLHCLNLVRQALYYNFEYYQGLGKGAFKNDAEILRFHVTHCLDIIRQQLMCTVDIGVLGQVWFNPEYPEAYVDFNTRHKCRNFDAVRQWAEEHQMPAEIPNDFLQPPEDGDMIYAEIP